MTLTTICGVVEDGGKIVAGGDGIGDAAAGEKFFVDVVAG